MDVSPQRKVEAMKSWSILLVISILTVAAIQPAAAADLSGVKAAGILRVGTEGTYAPFTYHEASGQLVGFDVEIARAVAAKLGVKAEFLEGKWDGLIAGLDAGRYDIVVNEVTITEARKAKYDFSEPYIVSKAALIVREDNTVIKDFVDLKGLKSAHTLTSNYAKLAEGYGADLVGTDGFDQSVALVLDGRADATINDSLSYLDFKKHKPDAKVKIVATRSDAEYEGIIFPKGEPDMKAAIDKALADVKADGTYTRISETYFGQDVSR